MKKTLAKIAGMIFTAAILMGSVNYDVLASEIIDGNDEEIIVQSVDEEDAVISDEMIEEETIEEETVAEEYSVIDDIFDGTVKVKDDKHDADKIKILEQKLIGDEDNPVISFTITTEEEGKEIASVVYSYMDPWANGWQYLVWGEMKKDKEDGNVYTIEGEEAKKILFDANNAMDGITVELEAIYADSQTIEFPEVVGAGSWCGYYNLSTWDADKWVPFSGGSYGSIDAPAGTEIKFAFVVGDNDNKTEFHRATCWVGMWITENGKIESTRYPEDAWQIINLYKDSEGNDVEALCTVFKYTVKEGGSIKVEGGTNFTVKAFSSVDELNKIGEKAEITLEGIQEWGGYFFESNSKTGEMSIIVKVLDPMVVPEFKYIDKEGIEKAITPIPTPDKDGDGNYVYTYKFGYSGGIKPEVLLKSESAWIQNKTVKQTVVYDDNIFAPTFKFDTKEGPELSINGSDEKYISVPYGHKLFIDLGVKDNCQATAVKVGTKTMAIKNGTVSTDVIKDAGTITLSGKELTTLYVDGEPCSGNKYVTSINKLDTLDAVIHKGSSGLYELNESMVTVKVGTKVYANGDAGLWTLADSDEDDKLDQIKFSFIDEKVAGNTVSVTIKDGKTTLGTMSVKVTAYAKTATVTGEKKGVITQDYGIAPKKYNVKFNTGVLLSDIAIKAENEDEDTIPEGLISYANGVLTIDASKENVESLVGKEGIKDINIKFMDSTADNKVFATKTLVLTNSALAKVAPTVKVIGASDVGFILNLAYPKNFDYADTCFKVNLDAVVDSKNPTVSDKMEEHIELYTTKTFVPVKVAKDGIDLGNGAVQKYNISTSIVNLTDITAQGIIEAGYNATINSIEDWDKTWGISRTAVIKNQSTKQAAYEKKLSLSVKKPNIYQGEKDILLATAKFNAKTTYYGLEFELCDANNDPIALSEDYDFNDPDKVSIIQGSVNNIVLSNTTSLEPGVYSVKIMTEAPEGTEKPVYTIRFTVLESIKSDCMSIATTLRDNKLEFVSGQAAAFPNKVLFSNDPKTPKVTWKVEAADGNDISATNLKNVTIDSKGKVTVKKTYNMSDGNNKFKITATAADYVGNTASASMEFTIVIPTVE